MTVLILTICHDQVCLNAETAAKLEWRCHESAGSEARCEDKSCSIDGVCPPTSLLTLSLYPSPEAFESSFNTPPTLELQAVAAADSTGVVRVPRGWLYSFCEPGVAGTVDQPCEPGTFVSCSCSQRSTTQNTGCLSIEPITSARKPDIERHSGTCWPREP